MKFVLVFALLVVCTGINDGYFVSLGFRFALVNDPYRSRNARIVKQRTGKTNDAFHQIRIQEFLPDFAFTARTEEGSMR